MTATVEKRIALVGASIAATEYLEVARDFPELSVESLVEEDAERAAHSAFSGLRHFSCVDDLLRYRAVPDVAVVCTPPGDHFEDCAPLLISGADLIVHTPLATDVVEAERLLELAERAGRELTTATPYRMCPAVAAGAELLKVGRIGAIRYLEIILSEKRDPAASWRGDPARSGGGVWMQLGPHSLDLAEELAGPVRKIRMPELQGRENAAVEDEVLVETDHGDGLVARHRLSWREERPEPLVRVVGDRGELEIGQTQTMLKGDGPPEPVGPGSDPRTALSALVVEHLRRRCSLHPPIDSGAETVGWIETAYRSVRDQRWLSV